MFEVNGQGDYGVIVESGSNIYGNYIKFSDGTLICYAQKIVDLNNSSIQTYPFPYSFLNSIASCSASALSSASMTTTDNLLGALSSIGLASYSQRWNVRTYSPSTNGSAPVDLVLFALGRWK